MTEKQMIVAIITHPAGYDVDLFSMFCVRPTEDGKFCVTYQPTGLPDPRNWEKCFDRPDEAVDYFLKMRQQLQLGIDIETKLMRQEQQAEPPVRAYQSPAVRPPVPVVRQPSSKPQGF